MSKSEYKSNFKTTLAFGGMQIISVLVSVLRGKMVAVFLGPVGMGINNLYLNTINLLSTFSGFGLELSTVRDISDNTSTNDKVLIDKNINLAYKIFLYTAIFGTVITILLSPLLSKWTFDNEEHVLAFIILSVFVFLTAMYKFQQTVMRGLRHINFILKSGIYGAVTGLVFSFPVYYLLGKDGIVWGILVGVIANFITSYIFYTKIKPINIKVTQKEVVAKGKVLMGFGIMLVISVLIGLLAKFIISVFIGKMGNIKDVGYYTAAVGISAQYIGFILSSLSADYFPRISAVQSDSGKLNAVVNEQIEIVLLLATPLLIMMLISSPLLITLFLSKEFLVIKDFIRFIAIGSFFQVASYCQGYISFAKNDKKTYFALEGVFSNVLQVGLTLLCYKIWGIFGLGIAYLVIYLIYFFLINVIVKKLYNYKNSAGNIKIFFTMFLFIFATFVIFNFFEENVYSYIFSSLILVANLLYCYYCISKKMDVKEMLKSKFRKR